eukprot:sb/3474464/
MIRSCGKILKFLTAGAAIFLLITFILPYDPEEIYGNREQNRNVIDLQPGKLGTIQGKTDTTQGKIESERKSDNESEDGRNSQKMFVILVTGFRTGSTFLGELFNQNDDSLYLFEPFHQNHIKSLVEKHAIRGESFVC